MWVVEGRKVCREAHKQEERSQDETGRPMHSMEFRKWVDRGWAFSSSPSFSYVFFSIHPRLTLVTLRASAWLPVMMMPQLELATQEVLQKGKGEIISSTPEPTSRRVMAEDRRTSVGMIPLASQKRPDW